jgi:hypothetical protein
VGILTAKRNRWPAKRVLVGASWCQFVGRSMFVTGLEKPRGAVEKPWAMHDHVKPCGSAYCCGYGSSELTRLGVPDHGCWDEAEWPGPDGSEGSAEGSAEGPVPGSRARVIIAWSGRSE